MTLVKPDFERLYSLLNNTKLQVTNPPLWSLIKELIRLLVDFAKLIIGSVNTSTTDVDNIKLRTFLTVNNETPYFPFSRQELAGENIVFDDSVTGERTVSAVQDIHPFLLMGA